MPYMRARKKSPEFEERRYPRHLKTGVADLFETRPPRTCYHVEIGRSRSNHVGVV